MDSNLVRLIDEIRGLRVLVIGEAMLDSYLEGGTGRICREAPVPVVNVTERWDLPGGAANTAVNVRSLGGDVAFLSVLGADPDGELLRGILEERGVASDELVGRAGRRTLSKQRVIAATQMLVRFDQGTTAAIDRETEFELIDRLMGLYSWADAVIVSDYGEGLMTAGLIQAIAAMQARTPRVLLVDSKRSLGDYGRVGATAVKPN